MKSVLIYLIFTASLLPGIRNAQDKPQHYYRMSFAWQELDGTKVVNGRDYEITCSTECLIKPSSEVVRSVQNSLRQFNLGLTIACSNLQESDSAVSFHFSVDSASLSPDAEPNALPVLRKGNWSGEALIPLRKQTVIFSSEDLTSKHKLQLLVTATLMK